MTQSAALKRKLIIFPKRPGRTEAAFAPIILSPFPKSVPSFFKALVIVPTTAPIVTPAARKMAVIVTPCFSNIAFTFSHKRSRSESFDASISLSFYILFNPSQISSISFSAFFFRNRHIFIFYDFFLVLVFLFLPIFLRFFKKPLKILIASHHHVYIHLFLIDAIVFADVSERKFASVIFY